MSRLTRRQALERFADAMAEASDAYDRACARANGDYLAALHAGFADAEDDATAGTEPAAILADAPGPRRCECGQYPDVCARYGHSEVPR